MLQTESEERHRRIRALRTPGRVLERSASSADPSQPNEGGFD